MRTTLLAPLVTTLLLMVLGTTGCSDDPEAGAGAGAQSSETPTPGPGSSDTASTPREPAPTSGPEPTRVEITFDGDSVTPNGERVDVPAGERFELVVTADAPGELHVHGTPEQELAYGAGTTRLPLTIDRPGIVEVESHHLGIVVVQLEVR